MLCALDQMVELCMELYVCFIALTLWHRRVVILSFKELTHWILKRCFIGVESACVLMCATGSDIHFSSPCYPCWRGCASLDFIHLSTHHSYPCWRGCASLDSIHLSTHHRSISHRYDTSKYQKSSVSGMYNRHALIIVTTTATHQARRA